MEIGGLQLMRKHLPYLTSLGAHESAGTTFQNPNFIWGVDYLGPNFMGDHNKVSTSH